VPIVISLDGSFARLRQNLETALIAQGLFPKEAQAMVETFYIVPSRAVDAVLPLQVEPALLQTVRVFVGWIELFTPDTMREANPPLPRATGQPWIATAVSSIRFSSAFTLEIPPKRTR